MTVCWSRRRGACQCGHYPHHRHHRLRQLLRGHAPKGRGGHPTHRADRRWRWRAPPWHRSPPAITCRHWCSVPFPTTPTPITRYSRSSTSPNTPYRRPSGCRHRQAPVTGHLQVRRCRCGLVHGHHGRPRSARSVPDQGKQGQGLRAVNRAPHIMLPPAGAFCYVVPPKMNNRRTYVV